METATALRGCRVHFVNNAKLLRKEGGLCALRVACLYWAGFPVCILVQGDALPPSRQTPPGPVLKNVILKFWPNLLFVCQME